MALLETAVKSARRQKIISFVSNKSNHNNSNSELSWDFCLPEPLFMGTGRTIVAYQVTISK